MGKEIISVLGSRFGKSGMSMFLSMLSYAGFTGLRQLGNMSLGMSAVWMYSTWWLSRLLPSKAEAQAAVQAQQQQKQNAKSMERDAVTSDSSPDTLVEAINGQDEVVVAKDVSELFESPEAPRVVGIVPGSAGKYFADLPESKTPVTVG